MSLLKQANEAFRNKNFSSARDLYQQVIQNNPEFAPLITANLRLAEKHATLPSSSSRAKVLVCGWNLAQNAAGRVATLAQLYNHQADVGIIGTIFKGWGPTEIWSPIRNLPLKITTITIEEHSRFLSQAMEMVAQNPCDLLHLSKPRFSNLLIGLLYKAIWNSTVLVDIDDEELAFVPATEPLSLDDFVKAFPAVPDTSNLLDAHWTRLAVGLAGAFDGVTVVNSALQQRYGGQIIRHTRCAKAFQPSAQRRRASRAALKLADSDKVVLFLGTPRAHKGLVETAKAIASSRKKETLFLVVGDFPPEAQQLKTEIESIRGLRYRFIGDQPFDRIPEILAAADLCVLLQDSTNLAARFQTPAKLTDALAMGLPVLAEKTPALEDLAGEGAFQLVDRQNLALALEKAQQGMPADPTPHPAFHKVLSEESHRPVVKKLLEQAKIPRRELSPELQKLRAYLTASTSFAGLKKLEGRTTKPQSQKKIQTATLPVLRNPDFDSVARLAAEAMAIDDWSGAYALWRALLEHPTAVLTIEQIVKISQELFQLDAFPDAANALKRAEGLDPKHWAVVLEKACQYYYHCYSSWLMLVTENEPDWYKADGLEVRPDWTTACALIEDAERVLPRNNLRRYVQAYLLLAEEAWDHNKREEAHAALRVALGAIGPNRIEKALADAIFRAVDQVRDGTLNPEDLYHQSLQDALAALPLELLPVQDWLCLNDILNWNGLLLCGYVAREKAVDLSIAKGEAPLADKETLKTALKAALDRSETALADEFLGRLQKISPEALDVRELDSCCELMKGNLEAFRAKWPHPPTPAEQKLREYLKGKSVAIVGPAPTGSLDGEEIDRHDVVVRINWRGVERQGDPKEFGSRTDISLYNAHSARFFKETKFKALGKQLKFFLLRRSIFKATELKSKGLVLQKISEFPATFYKSLNSLQATQFYFLLLCDGSQKYFKIVFYTGEQFHHKKYREKEGGKKERIINTIKTVLSNHDFPSQITIFRGLTKISVKKHHFFPHTQGIIKKISAKWIFINYTSSDLFLEKPKRQLLECGPFKSRSMNGDHLWYDNYATTILKNYSVACFPKKLDGKRILVIAHNFSLTTGASRSISHFLNALVVSKTDCSLESIEFNDGEDISRHSYIFDDKDIVIVNSLGVFKQNFKLVDLLENSKSANLFFYLHETEWTFKKFEEFNAELFKKVINLIRRNIALCVSKKQIEYLNTTHSISNTRLVGETSILPLDPWNFHFKCPRDNGVSKIVMVGTIQPRKGVDLFSRIADLAVSKKLNFRFIWVGKKIDHNVYLSKNVDWLGNKSSVEIQEILTNADLFFLSSIDDPMPLSVLEALQIRKKCVAYKETGAAELILEESSKIGEIFNEYSPESALKAINKALEKNTRFEDFDSVLEKHSLQNFSQKFTSALLSRKIRVDNLNINNIRNKLQKKVLLLCNGPSYSSASFDHINLEDCIIVRVNHFYLESKPFANGNIDFLFWSLGNATMHDNIIKNLKIGRYKINQFMCPVPYNALESNDLAFQNHMPEDSYYDHWALIAQNPRLARCMMSRPLPTTGIQALGCLMVLGFNDFLIAGMDFYSDPEKRYHYEIPDDFISKLDAKHLKPGYEKGAHSRETDSKFLKIILQEYPHCKIATTGSMPVLESILNKR